MKILKKVVPHLAICFSVATLVIAILNVFNPRMGFLDSKQAIILIILTVFFSVFSSLLYISDQFRNSSVDENNEE